jgi:MFS transporter, AAHS family, benzoate transport protein
MAKNGGTRRMRKVNVGDVIDSSRFNGWYATLWGLGALAIIFDSYDTQAFGVALPVMQKDLALTPAVLGFIASLSAWSSGLGSMVMGVLADRLGAKNVLITGIVVYTAFTGLCGLVTDISQFAVLRFISGFGLAAMTPIVSSILSEYSPKKIRSQVVANVCLGFTLGQLIAIGAGILLLAAFSWRIMYLLAFPPIILALWAYFKVPDSMSRYHRRGETEKIRSVLGKVAPDFQFEAHDTFEVSEVHRQRVSVAKTLPRMFAPALRRQTSLIWIIYFCNGYLLVLIQWLPILQVAKGASLTASLTATLVYAGFAGLAMPLSSYLVDHFGFRRPLIVSYIATAVMMLLFTIRMDNTLYLVFLAIAGLALGPQQPLTNAFCTQNFPLSIRNSGIGISLVMSRLAAAAAPILIGVLLTVATPDIVFLHFIPFALVGGLAYLATRPIPNFSSETFSLDAAPVEAAAELQPA